MQYLITGANGFVGKYLQEELTARGIPYLAAGRAEFDLSRIEEIDVYFSRHNITHVIHLAGAVGSDKGEALFQGNIAGLYNILFVCVRRSVKHFLYTSSNVVYGPKGSAFHRESDILAPDVRDWYAVSKYVGELIVEKFCLQHNLQYALVRIGDIYGPKQRLGNLIKAIVNSIATAQPLKLYGAGVRARDYIYVTDVVNGLATIAEKEFVGAINLGSGVGTTVEQLIKTAQQISNGVCSIEHVPVEQEDTSNITLDTRKLCDLGFSPKVSIYDGLSKCIMERAKDE